MIEPQSLLDLRAQIVPLSQGRALRSVDGHVELRKESKATFGVRAFKGD